MKIIDDLIIRYPQLSVCRASIMLATNKIIDCYKNDKTLFLAGNGGSAADAEHICGELLKGFCRPRSLSEADKNHFTKMFGEDGTRTAQQLQYGLRAISLLSHSALLSAFANDVNPHLVYAQQLFALARNGDIFFGISTSGKAENIRHAFSVAKTKAMTTILLTGNQQGICRDYAEIIIAAPEAETYKIQELHQPIYHAICRAIEAEFF